MTAGAWRKSSRPGKIKRLKTTGELSKNDIVKCKEKKENKSTT